MLDIALLKLQYEILNKPIEALASENSVPVSALSDVATNANWTQHWPENEVSSYRSRENDEGLSIDERMEQDAEYFVEVSKRRLQVYTVAKELHFCQRYAALESAVLDKALDIVDTLDVARDVKSMSALLKDLTTNSITSALASMSFTVDDQGMPSVIIRDLSGK